MSNDDDMTSITVTQQGLRDFRSIKIEYEQAVKRSFSSYWDFLADLRENFPEIIRKAKNGNGRL